MEKDKVSIIVPVYNVELWLEECVDSIINQTYRNIEILLIDDGSPDQCPFLCDAYAKKDERIRVIHKENGGVSSARNAGIEAATGEYITFIDSDDYVDENYVLKLYNNLKGCSISECGTVGFDDSGCRRTVYKEPIVLNWEQYLTETNLNGFLSYAVVVAKLYSRDVFSNVKFPIGRINGEDEGTAFKLVYNGKKVSRIYDALYFYRQRDTGASRNRITGKRIKDCDDLFNEKIAFFEEKERKDLASFFSAKKAVAFIGLCKTTAERDKKLICDKIIRDMWKKFWLAPKVPLKYKIYTLRYILFQSIDRTEKKGE